MLGCLFYAYYVFVRLCIPQFRSISMQLFDLRAMVLCVFNSILPGKAPSHSTNQWRMKKKVKTFFRHCVRCVCVCAYVWQFCCLVYWNDNCCYWVKKQKLENWKIGTWRHPSLNIFCRAKFHMDDDRCQHASILPQQSHALTHMQEISCQIDCF